MSEKQTNNETESTIVVCQHCNGEGKIETKTLVGYHNSEYSYDYKECQCCKGSGCLIEVIKTSYTAFKRKKS